MALRTEALVPAHGVHAWSRPVIGAMRTTPAVLRISKGVSQDHPRLDLVTRFLPAPLLAWDTRAPELGKGQLVDGPGDPPSPPVDRAPNENLQRFKETAT